MTKPDPVELVERDAVVEALEAHDKRPVGDAFMTLVAACRDVEPLIMLSDVMEFALRRKVAALQARVEAAEGDNDETEAAFNAQGARAWDIIVKRRAELDALEARTTSAEAALVECLGALEPFVAMCRVLESRAMMTFGRAVPDREKLCESGGEVGSAVVRMGHFRRAAEIHQKHGGKNPQQRQEGEGGG